MKYNFAVGCILLKPNNSWYDEKMKVASEIPENDELLLNAFDPYSLVKSYIEMVNQGL